MAFYQRHLPHWQPKQAEFFITFRLAGSLPAEAINRLQSYRKQVQDTEQEDQNQIQRNIFQKYEGLLDKFETGPTWLREEKVAQIVQGALNYYDKEHYDLYAFTIMPNHVHLVFRHLNISKSSEYGVT
ncbi:MAG TPA: hypothetical protein VF181_05825, partial [Balneolaceae bacterium]